MLYTGVVLFAALSLFLVGVVPHPQTSFAHEPGFEFGPRLADEIRKGDIRIRLEPVATGLTAPTRGAAAPGDARRLYVTDQIGIVWAIDVSSGAKSMFLDVRSRLVPLGKFGPGSFDERGLLGIAFHPQYATNGRLYTYTSEPTAGAGDHSTIPAGRTAHHQNVIAEWRAVDPGNPSRGVDAGSRRELMRNDHPQFNHDGGDVVFGPDGMLYIGIGDGGGADDQDGQEHADGPVIGHQGDGNGQKLNTVHGKILRIDPMGSNSRNGKYGIPADNPFVGRQGALGEIYAYGFRNPLRLTFHPTTNELYVGDIGQNDIEEVDIVVKGGNYGWNLKEGSFFFDPSGPEVNSGTASTENRGRVPAGMTLMDPVAEYDTHLEGHSVMGGFVYRGSRIPELQGRYVFGDFAWAFINRVGTFGRLFYLQPKAGGGMEIKEFQLVGQDWLEQSVLGWGEDSGGELYVLASSTGNPSGETGVVMRIAPGGVAAPAATTPAMPPAAPGPGPAPAPPAAPAAAAPAAAAPPAQVPRQLPRTGGFGEAASALAAVAGSLLLFGAGALRRRRP